MDAALAAGGLLRRNGVASIVVDCESGPVRLGLPGRLAVAMGGACVRLEQLSADAVAGLVRAARSVA
jgi:magnesium chelatase subunit D